MAKKKGLPTMLAVRLPLDLHAQLRRLAGANGLTVSAYVRMLLELDALRAKATGQ